MLILLVEDDVDYSDMISHVLQREGHEVVAAGTLEAARRFAEKKEPELAVLDVVLPDGSGMDVCAALRGLYPSLPTLFLSSLDRPEDVVAGLESGGDDYLTKPFHPSELAARVRAIARRGGGTLVAERPAARRLGVAGLELDTSNQAAYFDGTNLNVTRLEFEVLAELVRYPGQVLSHAFLTERIWGYKNVEDATLLKGHLSAIRRKIRDAGAGDDTIRTVHGVGYCFTPV